MSDDRPGLCTLSVDLSKAGDAVVGGITSLRGDSRHIKWKVVDCKNYSVSTISRIPTYIAYLKADLNKELLANF